MSENKCERCVEYQKRIKELEEKLYIDIQFEDESNEDCFDLSESRLENIINKYYTEEFFYKGKDGIVEFISKYIVINEEKKKLYTCTNIKKMKFEYNDGNQFVIDIKAKTLLDNIYSPLVKKANKIYHILLNKIYDNCKVVENENEYDSDEEEIIAQEMVGEKDENTDRVDDIVKIFLEIKKSFKRRKPIIDELCELLY